MKKTATILLVLLILASCFVLTSCNFTRPLCPDGCSFPFDENGNRERVCEICGNYWCTVRGYHNWDYTTGKCSWCGKYKCKVDGEHTYDISGKCTGCGTTVCKEKGHTYDNATGKCVVCSQTTCKSGDHNFDKTTGNCTYCGKSACKTGKHDYNIDDVCTWCNKTVCQAEGHNYYEGCCIKCGKVSAFAWVYDIFDKQPTLDQGGSSDNEWTSTCPEGNGVHGWLKGECIYCGAVLSDADEMNFWDAVGQGVLIVAFMIATTAFASLIYWLGCLFNWSWFVWIGHALMMLMTLGMFVAIHWIWGIVFLLLFDGAYIALICPMITQKTLGYNGIIH